MKARYVQRVAAKVRYKELMSFIIERSNKGFHTCSTDCKNTLVINRLIKEGYDVKETSHGYDIDWGGGK